jgi:hypothetical protein
MRLSLNVNEDLWPAQLAFYEEKDHEVVGYIGGWGSGKSYIGARKALELCFVNKLTPGVVVGPSLGQVKDTTLPIFGEYLEKIGLPYTEIRGQKPAFILPWGNPARLSPGWIMFRSLDRPGSLKGLTIGWAWLDEPGEVEKGEEAWQLLRSRVRHPDAARIQTILTGTGEAQWLKERFLDDQNPDYIYYRASTRENLALRPSYVEELMRELPPNLREVYIEGGFMPPETGLVCDSFSPEHNISSDVLYNPGLPLVYSLDFNVNPHCSIYGQTNGEDAWVIDEIVLAHSNTPAAVAEFIKRCGGHKSGIHVYGDPSGTHRSTNSTQSDYDIIREAFRRQFGRENIRFFYRQSDPGQRARANAANRMFSDSTGRRRGLIHPRCRHLIYDLLHLPWTEKGKIDKDVRNRKFGWTISHLFDALAYWWERKFPILKPRVRAL